MFADLLKQLIQGSEYKTPTYYTNEIAKYSSGQGGSFAPVPTPVPTPSPYGGGGGGGGAAGGAGDSSKFTGTTPVPAPVPTPSQPASSATLTIPGTTAPQLSDAELAAQRQAAEEAEIARLLPMYEASRADISAQLPLLEKGYNTARDTITGAIGAASDTATRQADYLRGTFGDLLKNISTQFNTLSGNAVNRYNDLNRQRQNLFSNLGTLDSSEFGEQQFRSDQSLANQLTELDLERLGQTVSTERERENKIADVQDKFSEYERQANQQLADLALQYQSGQQAIQSALVQNDLQGAAAIQSALDALREKAMQIQESVTSAATNFANEAALLQAQGVDVTTNLGNITASDFATKLSNALAGQNSRVYGQLAGLNLPGSGNTVPQSAASGAFISPGGQKFGSYAEYLRSLLGGTI